MATTAKTAGKTARVTKPSILSWLEESVTKWQQDGDSIMLSAKELRSVIECKVKCYSGEFGDFARLYLTLNIKGKIMSIKDSEGGRSGIKLDITSLKRLDLEEGDEMEINPEKCIFYNCKNVETGDVTRRVRVLK